MKYFKIIIGMLVLTSVSFGNAEINGFDGYQNDARIIIQWNTSMEQGIVGFEVQRSTDGHTFFEIGFLNAQGQGSGYTFVDDSIIAKVSGRNYYYRLKIRNLDGNSQMSAIIEVQSISPVIKQTWGSLKALFK